MTGYAIQVVDEAPDAFGGKYPGAMRFLGGPLGAEQVAITHRHMPPKSGGKGSYGHRHKTQEEIYYVVSGRLQFKVGDDVVEVGPRTAVRVAPQTWRSVWNDGPGDAELVIVSIRVDAPRDDTEYLEDFWPE